MLVEVGDKAVPFFLVVSGAIEILRPSGGTETLIVTHHAGQFLGEGNMLTGRRSLIRAHVTEPGEVIELDPKQLFALVQTDAELSEILMRAFILRRVELIARGLGDVVLIGSTHCAGTLRVKEFLTRNGHPYTYIDLDRDAEAQELLDRFHVSAADVPVLICRGDAVLRNPSNQQIAECLGFNDAIDQTHIRDVVIVGAGPAGLAAAVYGASEGLDVLVLESNVARRPGGIELQDRKLSRVSDGHFRTGADRPRVRAGPEIRRADHDRERGDAARVRPASRTRCEIDETVRVPARAVIIATGAEYRKPPIENLSQFEGAGIYYAATPMEAQLCARRGGRGHRRRQFSGPGCGVPRADGQARAHARPRPGHWRTRCRAISFAASKTTLRSTCARRRSSWRWKETGISSASAGATSSDSRDRDARHPPRVHHGRRRAEHRLARRLRRARRQGLHQDGSGSLAGGSGGSRGGRWHGRRICSRPVVPVCLPSATCAAATSSAWHRRSARDRSRSPSSTRCFTNRAVQLRPSARSRGGSNEGHRVPTGEDFCSSNVSSAHASTASSHSQRDWSCPTMS